MHLDNIINNSLESLIYMERYVNDGSPSGFTELYNTSNNTNPFSLNKSFILPYIKPSKNFISDFGDFVIINKELPFFNSTTFFIHPDMIGHYDIKKYKVFRNEMHVIPTSSSRTVHFISNKTNFYLKLHYDGIIGRINRSLPYLKAISGFEISTILQNGINDDIYPKYFSYYREIGVRVLYFSNIKSWSFILREGKPYKINKSTCCIVPFFSLFSNDRLNSNKTLLYQLAIKHGSKIIDMIVNLIIKRIIKIYFKLILNEGLQFELNAQNILIGFDNNFTPTLIIFRDLMGVEKDITIRQKNGLSNNFLSTPYKFIHNNLDNDLYQIRHSFSFDFKLSKYIIEPLLNELQNIDFIVFDIKKYSELIKDYSHVFIKLLDKDYFPNNNKWYYHENVLLTEKRIYKEAKNPLYR